MTSKERLKEYLEADILYQDYKKGKEPAHNDGCFEFDLFCIQHCQDIEDLLNENEFLRLSNPEQNIEHFRILKENKQKIDNLRKENKELHNKIDKAIEYLEDDDNFWILDSYSEDKVKMIQEELKQILKDGDVDG